MNENAKHAHSFSVDTSCECGVMLSDYTREITKLNAELVAALKDQLRQQSNIEVLGEYEGLEINSTTRKRLRAQIEQTNEIANAVIAKVREAK